MNVCTVCNRCTHVKGSTGRTEPSYTCARLDVVVLFATVPTCQPLTQLVSFSTNNLGPRYRIVIHSVYDLPMSRDSSP